MQFIKVPIIELETEYIYSQALRFFLYMYLGGQWHKRDFIHVAVSRGMSRTTADRIWNRWAYVNKYISIAHTDFCSITTIHSIGNVLAMCSEKELKKVTSLNAFKNLMIWLHAGRPKKIDAKVGNEEQYLRHNKSITLNGLAKRTWLSCKQSAFRRMKTALKTFWGNTTKRYSTYNWKIARLSNVYSNEILYIYDRYSHHKTSASQRVKTIYMGVSKTQWNKEKVTSKLEWLRPEEYIDCYKNLYI